jgi:hypothetical protein
MLWVFNKYKNKSILKENIFLGSSEPLGISENSKIEFNKFVKDSKFSKLDQNTLNVRVGRESCDSINGPEKRKLYFNIF